MEVLNLQQLSLILDQELVILEEDIQTTSAVENPQFKQERTNGDEISLAQEPSVSYTKSKERDSLVYDGGFEKAILIVYQGSSLKSNEREFITNILGAVGCSIDDVALVSSSRLMAVPIESIGQLNPIKCLVFGEMDHPIMQHKISNYQITGDETNYFFADTLDDLLETVQLKRNLWNGLQVLFQIKK